MAGDKAWIKRRIIYISGLADVLFADGEHTWLTIAVNLSACNFLKPFFRAENVRWFGIPVVAPVGGNFVPLIKDTAHQLGSVVGKGRCAKEGRLYVVGFQNIENAGCTVARHFHRFFQRVVDTRFTGYIEFFCIKT